MTEISKATDGNATAIAVADIPFNVRTELLKLLIRQGPWGLVLFAVLGIIYQQVPPAVNAITSGYDRVESRNQKATDQIVNELKGNREEFKNLTLEQRETNDLMRQSIEQNIRSAALLQDAVEELKEVKKSTP